MLNVGVIGLGVGNTHCQGYMDSEHANLVAVCDLMESRLSQAKSKYGIDVYEDVDKFLARRDIDAISICTPGYAHVDIAIKALRAGKHVLLEKPMALCLEDCELIIEEANRAGTVCGVGYEFRLNPVILEMKRLIASGEIGRLCGLAMYYWRGPFMRNKYQKWIQDEKLSGGLLVEETCHWFDLLRWFGGSVAELHCYTNGGVYPDFNFEDMAFVNMKYESGAVAQLSHVLTGFDYCFLLWAFGDKKSIWAVQKDQEKSLLGVGDKDFCGMVAVRDVVKVDFEPWEDGGFDARKFGAECKESENIKALVKDFVDSIKYGKSPVATLEDGFRSVELSLAAKKSARSGDVIHQPAGFDYLFPGTGRPKVTIG